MKPLVSSEAETSESGERCLDCARHERVEDSALGTHLGALSAIAAQLLGWRPDEFWSATPAELALALGKPEEGAILSFTDLARLQEQFPDG